MRVLTPCKIAEKALKMAILSKTGSRNMAETCAINFSYPTSYSTSIGTPSALSNGRRAGQKISCKIAKCRFCVFPIFDHPLQKKQKTQRNNFGRCIDIHRNIYFARYESRVRPNATFSFSPTYSIRLCHVRRGFFYVSGCQYRVSPFEVTTPFGYVQCRLPTSRTLETV